MWRDCFGISCQLSRVLVIPDDALTFACRQLALEGDSLVGTLHLELELGLRCFVLVSVRLCCEYVLHHVAQP